MAGPLKKNNTKPLDSTRLTDTDRRTLLRELDGTGAPAPRNASRRMFERFEYHAPNILMTIGDKRATDLRFIVHARNISREGMSFLHGGFLHKGTECSVVLRANSGEHKLVKGKVASCRFLTRNVHEVGVQFHERITLEDFCAPGAKVVSAKKISVALPPLPGLALCVAPKSAERASLVEWLSACGLGVIECDDTGRALDKIKRLRFTLVLCDEAACQGPVAHAIDAMRKAGHTNTIVALAASDQPPPGADAAIRKPPNCESLAEALAAAGAGAGAGGEGAEPICSVAPPDAGSPQVLAGFIERLHADALRIERTIEQGNRTEAMQICQQIKSTASGYGFPSIAEAAAEALAALDRATDAASATRQLSVLLTLCMRATAAGPQPQAAAA